MEERVGRELEKKISRAVSSGRERTATTGDSSTNQKRMQQSTEMFKRTVWTSNPSLATVMLLTQ